MLGGDGDRRAVAFHGAGLGIGKFGPAVNDLHLSAFEQHSNAGVELFDDTVLPPNCFGEIERRRLLDRNAKRAFSGRTLHFLELAGNVDERLRRYATANKAGSSEAVAFYDHRIEAELSGADSRDIAARPGAHDEHLGVYCRFHHFKSMNRVTGCSIN